MVIGIPVLLYSARAQARTGEPKRATQMKERRLEVILNRNAYK